MHEWLNRTRDFNLCFAKVLAPQLFGLVVVDLDHIHYEGSMLLRNFIIHLQDYMISQLRRPQSEIHHKNSNISSTSVEQVSKVKNKGTDMTSLCIPFMYVIRRIHG